MPYLSYMKYIITESQYRFLTEDKDQKILKLPGLDYFGSWKNMQKFLEKRGNPAYSIEGNLDLGDINIETLGNLVYIRGYLDLSQSTIESLGNLEYVGGNLYLYDTKITSLGNLKSVGGYLNLTQSNINDLGNLEYVGGNLYLNETPIQSFGNLKSVGGNLDLKGTQISRMYSKNEIREMIDVSGRIFM
jgi:hypothetical protein